MHKPHIYVLVTIHTHLLRSEDFVWMEYIVNSVHAYSTYITYVDGVLEFVSYLDMYYGKVTEELNRHMNVHILEV